jgi:Arc/MetJ-type ribon-helix-helix transcriptional regulator
MVGNGEAKVSEWDDIQPVTIRLKASFVKAFDELVKSTSFKSRSDLIESMLQEWAKNKVVVLGYKDLDSFILELKQKIQEQVPQVTKETIQPLQVEPPAKEEPT